jgi:hypothetical protein
MKLTGRVIIAAKPATPTFDPSMRNRSAGNSSAHTATLLVGGNAIGAQVSGELEEQVA